MNTPEDLRFPIRELSARTKVNPVTIRAWERRYGLLVPERTDKGHRLYSEKDVVTVNKILALVARGVPLVKVKPLLRSGATFDVQSGESENWSDSIVRFISAAQSFSSTRLQHLIGQFLSNYPAHICCERWFEPSFSQLARQDNTKAIYGFAESELVRYVNLRLSVKLTRKNRGASVLLVSGEQTPIWRLAVMAMALFDANFSVVFVNRSFTVAAGVVLASKLKDATIVFYQDGQWRLSEQTMIANALQSNSRLLVCGTAPLLAQLEVENQVFADVESCIKRLCQTSDVN